MSPNSNEISMQIVRNYVLKARDLVIEEIINEQKTKKDKIKKMQKHEKTTENWWGDNEDIPIKYLIPTDEVSIEDTLKKGINMGSFNKMNTTNVSYMILGMIDQTLGLWISNSKEKSIENITSQVLDFIYMGIKK